MSAIRSLLIVLLLPCLAVAENPYLGQKVFWMLGAKATVDDKEVDIDTVPFPALASKAEGDRLWLETAWVQSDDVLLADGALAYYSRQIRGDAKNSELWRCRAAIWREKGEFNWAIMDCDEAIRLDPTSAAAYRNRGLARIEVRDYDNAIDDFTDAIRLDPASAAAYGGRGLAWSEKGDYDNAVKDFTDVIRLEPASYKGYGNRANARTQKGDYRSAIDDATEVIRLDPEAALGGYILRAQAWNGAGNHDKAIEDCTEAIRLDPTAAAGYCFRAQAYSNKKEFDSAIKDCGEAIRIDPALALSYWVRGWVYMEREDYDDAIDDANALLRIAPGYAYAYFLRGSAQNGKEDHGSAVADYCEAAQLDSTLSAAHVAAAAILATCGDDRVRNGAKAVTYATRACELTEWKEAAAIETLAAADAESGDFESAIKWQEKAIGMATSDTETELDDRKSRLALFRAGKPYRWDTTK